MNLLQFILNVLGLVGGEHVNKLIFDINTEFSGLHKVGNGYKENRERINRESVEAIEKMVENSDNKYIQNNENRNNQNNENGNNQLLLMNVQIMLVNLLQIREVGIAVIENGRVAEYCRKVLCRVEMSDMKVNRRQIVFTEQLYSVIQ